MSEPALRILRKHKETEGLQYDKRLKPCPLCGAKAFVMHDIVDGFEFGYSVGCPRACIGDKHHKLMDEDTFKAAKLTFFGLASKEEAIRIWNERVEKGV